MQRSSGRHRTFRLLIHMCAGWGVREGEGKEHLEWLQVSFDLRLLIGHLGQDCLICTWLCNISGLQCFIPSHLLWLVPNIYTHNFHMSLKGQIPSFLLPSLSRTTNFTLTLHTAAWTIFLITLKIQRFSHPLPTWHPHCLLISSGQVRCDMRLPTSGPFLSFCPHFSPLLLRSPFPTCGAPNAWAARWLSWCLMPFPIAVLLLMLFSLSGRLPVSSRWNSTTTALITLSLWS